MKKIRLIFLGRNLTFYSQYYIEKSKEIPMKKLLLLDESRPAKNNEGTILIYEKGDKERRI